jgi:hypothetical protein
MIVAELTGQYADNKMYKQDDSLVSNEDGIGVELEMENIQFFKGGCLQLTPYLKRLPLPLNYWKPVEDGSLREGTEFIFKGALFGANITAALDDMAAFLSVFKRNGKPVKITDRCSVHVHLDVRDFDENQLNNLILVYLLVERVLFQHINPLRLKNNYCRPLSDSSFKFTLNDMLSNTGSRGLPNLSNVVKRDCDKYSALNVLPINKYGSVEFRHHHGTDDMTAIKNWVNIILAIKKISRVLTIHNLLDIYNREGCNTLLSTIFKGTVLEDDLYISNLEGVRDLVAKGVVDIKEIVNMNKLKASTSNRLRSRSRSDNTLLTKYKLARGGSLNTNESPEFNDQEAATSLWLDAISIGA